MTNSENPAPWLDSGSRGRGSLCDLCELGGDIFGLSHSEGKDVAKTALDLTPEEYRAYHPGKEWDQEVVAARWDRAWEVARDAARLLREKFGAKRVVVFGSLAHRTLFSPWSDVDLAAWEIPVDRFYRAIAAVIGMGEDIEVDLVDPKDCRPKLREIIEREGIEL
jgi:predicted nucleotidyltransferase